jgi:hypothetical protein
MTPFELIAYLRTNPITPALIPILKANYIDADGHDEIDLQDLESFVFYQRNQLPKGRKKTIKKRTTKEIISEQISYKRIDKEDTSLIYRHSGEGNDNWYNYEYQDALKNSVHAWIDEDEYSDTYGKQFLTIYFQSIELAGENFDEQGGISLFSPSSISLEDYYYDIDNSVSEFNSWAQWDSYYSRNYIRLEYAGFSIPSLNYPPR